MAFPKHVGLCEGDKGRRCVRSLLIEATIRAKCQRQLAGSAAAEKRGNLLFNGLFHCIGFCCCMFFLFLGGFFCSASCLLAAERRQMKTDGAREEKSDDKCTKQSVLSHFWEGGGRSQKRSCRFLFSLSSTLEKTEHVCLVRRFRLQTCNQAQPAGDMHTNRTLGCFQWQMCLF